MSALVAVALLIPVMAMPATAAALSPGADDALVRALVTAEETGLIVSRKLEVLSKGLLDLRLPGPDPEAAAVFASSVTVTDLGPVPPAWTTVADAPIPEVEPWPAAVEPRPVASVDLWRSLLDRVAFLDHARIALVQGDHPGGNLLRYQAAVEFTGLARMKSGEWRSLEIPVALTWERATLADGAPTEWRIIAWRTGTLRGGTSPRRLFAETLDTAVRSREDVLKLRRSQHYEAVVNYYRGGMKKLPHPYFAPISVNQKEGIAIADVNGDGFDDIYITVRLGRNLLLVNHGDGTFSEQAARYHLDLPGHTTCALFADFDNDGDLDAMLGRSLLKSTYLENRDGVFVQLPIPSFMPMAVISMAAADYNGDGLLDLYLCTYRPAAPAGSGMAGGYAQVAKEGDFDWPDEFFPPEQAREFRRRLAEHRQRLGASVLDQLGPPNVLLVNRGGGRFEPAPENATVGLWRNSLQATWCDYNSDGRPDLYIPNDWGMNVLFRNDGPAGFTDVTTEMGLTSYGFSMGASFGDYDNDGREDLYVSNMESAAGRRMTARVPGLDPQLIESAAGNFLYHRTAAGRFQQVAGLEAPALKVARAGWSWGGCFTDFDNDGFLDLYVLNGYFTAPRELASGLDLESNLWRSMLRADARVARPSFRLSPEWRRTPPPDKLGPEIDARLVGVERQGDQVRVHSLHGHERNRYFANRNGRTFADLSGLSGLDHPADSRGFAVLDYDRDGWADVALVNANQPLFNLYRNEAPAAGAAGGVIALRFVGGNRTAAPSSQHSCRDGVGARVTVELGDLRLVREHRCGDGWSIQNSATLLVGIGAHRSAASVSIRWPSGRTNSTAVVPEGTLLTVYENPADSPTGDAFTRQPYRVAMTNAAAPAVARPVFGARALDTAARPARLRVYTAFAASHPASAATVTSFRRLVETLRPEGIDFIAVPLDPADDNARLSAFANEHKPAARLINLPRERRGDAAEAFAKVFGTRVPPPATVITDDAGQVLRAEAGVPHLSALRALLPFPELSAGKQ